MTTYITPTRYKSFKAMCEVLANNQDMTSFDIADALNISQRHANCVLRHGVTLSIFKMKRFGRGNRSLYNLGSKALEEYDDCVRDASFEDKPVPVKGARYIPERHPTRVKTKSQRVYVGCSFNMI